ncbi:MAG: ABC transporter permease [Caldiserica bacterium]|jgi:peptide/nickel transport system permease protein|nr:ABC transporter permease [Caldisericota bacterium]
MGAIKGEEIKVTFHQIGHFWYKFSRKPISVAGLFVVLTVIFLAIFADWIAPYPDHAGPYVNLTLGAQPPSKDFILGTDIYGRDILSRILFAFRPALLTGIVVLSIVVPIGTVLGLIAGYYSGKWQDTIIMRITDVFLGLPPLILALAVSAVLKPNLFNSMVAVSIAFWPWYARMVYGMVSSLRNEYFVIYSELMGERKTHILFKEILPNCISPIFTKMTLDFGWVVILSASLSFVGLGEQPPTPALGTMVAEGSRFLPDQWWTAVFPAIAIVIMVLGFNLLGDGLRDALTSEES